MSGARRRHNYVLVWLFSSDSAEKFVLQIGTRQIQVSGHVLENTSQRPDSKALMRRNCDVMLLTPNARCETNVTSDLTRRFVSVATKQL